MTLSVLSIPGQWMHAVTACQATPVGGRTGSGRGHGPASPPTKPPDCQHCFDTNAFAQKIDSLTAGNGPAPRVILGTKTLQALGARGTFTQLLLQVGRMFHRATRLPLQPHCLARGSNKLRHTQPPFDLWPASPVPSKEILQYLERRRHINLGILKDSMAFTGPHIGSKRKAGIHTRYVQTRRAQRDRH